MNFRALLLRALLLRARDLLCTFGNPPYSVIDRQSVHTWVSFYSLERAIAVADPTGGTAKDGSVCDIMIDGEPFRFTRDRKGRLHLPKALRSRML